MCEAVIRNIFFLRILQLGSTETFYEFSINKVHSFQETYKDMSFRLKSTSFKPKTSEQMKNRYAFKLYPENTTGLDRTGSTKFFLQTLWMMLQGQIHLGYLLFLCSIFQHHVFYWYFFSWYVIVTFNFLPSGFDSYISSYTRGWNLLGNKEKVTIGKKKSIELFSLFI